MFVPIRVSPLELGAQLSTLGRGQRARHLGDLRLPLQRRLQSRVGSPHSASAPDRLLAVLVSTRNKRAGQRRTASPILRQPQGAPLPTHGGTAYASQSVRRPFQCHAAVRWGAVPLSATAFDENYKDSDGQQNRQWPALHWCCRGAGGPLQRRRDWLQRTRHSPPAHGLTAKGLYRKAATQRATQLYAASRTARSMQTCTRSGRWHTRPSKSASIWCMTLSVSCQGRPGGYGLSGGTCAMVSGCHSRGRLPFREQS